MDYVNFGHTGLKVSRLCLGCMSFGEKDRGTHAWTLDEGSSRRLIRQAVDAGINFFDTANACSDGPSEEIVGRAQHLADAIAALAVKLSDEEVKQLESPCIPHPIVGFF